MDGQETELEDRRGKDGWAWKGTARSVIHIDLAYISLTGGSIFSY